MELNVINEQARKPRRLRLLMPCLVVSTTKP